MVFGVTLTDLVALGTVEALGSDGQNVSHTPREHWAADAIITLHHPTDHGSQTPA